MARKRPSKTPSENINLIGNSIADGSLANETITTTPAAGSIAATATLSADGKNPGDAIAD